jgi:hypothetical protein
MHTSPYCPTTMFIIIIIIIIWTHQLSRSYDAHTVNDRKKAANTPTCGAMIVGAYYCRTDPKPHHSSKSSCRFALRSKLLYYIRTLEWEHSMWYAFHRALFFFWFDIVDIVCVFWRRRDRPTRSRLLLWCVRCSCRTLRTSAST